MGAIRRIKDTVVRTEAEPYRFTPARRTPRLGAAPAILWFVPSAGIAAGSLPPSGTKGGPLTGQTIYADSGAGYVALPGTYKVYNPMGSPVIAGKMTAVKPNADGTYDSFTQSCA